MKFIINAFKLIFYLHEARNTSFSVKSLQNLAVASIEQHISTNNYDVAKILKRIYPEIFDEINGNIDIIRNFLLGKQKINSQNINLSDLNLNSIPLVLISKFENIKELDLSHNPEIRLSDSWFNNLPKNNLSKLSLKSCSPETVDFNALKSLKNLKYLDISSIDFLEIRNNDFKEILSKLTHLEISNLDLSREDQEFIFENGCNIEYLNISNNPGFHFSGNKSINFLSSIRHLYASNCKLTDSDIKVIFENAINLELLDVSNNREINIQSSKYLKVLGNIISLDLSNCKLSILDFEFVVKYAQRLEFFNFSDNKLFNQLIAGFVSDLPLSDCSFTESLKSLKMARCSLLTNHLLALLKFPNLKELDLEGNMFDMINDQLAKEIFEESCSKYKISCFNILEILNLKKTKIPSFEFFKNVFELKKLKELKISSCYRLRFNFSNLKNFCSSNSIEYLEMTQFNQRENPESINFLKQFKKLKTLILIDFNMGPLNDSFNFRNLYKTLTHLTIEKSFWNTNGLKEVSNFKNLIYLNLSNNNFEGLNEIIDFSQCKRLGEVKIEDSFLNPNGFLSFLKCFSLRKLNINHNSIHNLSEIEYFDFKKCLIEDLEVSNCYLQKPNLNLLFSLPNLKRLNISSNNFSNTDENFKFSNYSESLKYLDMSLTGLNSHLFYQITNFPKLEILNISSNYFWHNDSNNMVFGCSKNSLKILIMMFGRINEDFLREIAHSTYLKSLNLNFTKLESLSAPLNYKNLKYSLINFIFPDIRLTRVDDESIDRLDFCLYGLKNCLKLRNITFNNPEILTKFESNLKI